MASQDPREIALQAALPTPRRTVSVQWDVTEGVADEPFFLQYREGRQLLPQTVSGCIRLRSGTWQLAPLNDWGTNHESEIGQSFVIRLSAWYANNILVEVPHQRNPSELTGITPSSEVSAAGDYFLTKRIGAGLTWSNELPNSDVPPDIAADNHYPLEFLARTYETHIGMSGYMLKGIIQGAPMQTKDVILGWKWGGLVRAEGYGQFFLALKGDGTAILYEKYKPEGEITVRWVKVATWRFMSPAEMPGGAFGLWILPFSPDGIEFDTYTGGGEEDYFKLLSDRSLDILSGLNATEGAHQSYVFRTNRGILARTAGNNLHPVTGMGSPELYIRQEIRPLIQVARLAYGIDIPEIGVLTDKAIALPQYCASDEHVIRVSVKGYNTVYPEEPTARTSMEATLFNAEDGVPLTADTEAGTWRGEAIEWEGFLPPGAGTKNAIQAEISLTANPDENGETWWTPYLTAYVVVRNGNLGTHAPGVKTGGTVTRVSTSGPGYDPEAETGFLRIEDTKNELAFLRSRGKASVRVSTTFQKTDGTESTETCVLYDGYTGRVTSSLRGKDGMIYPSADWRDLEAECEGKWQRLTEKFFHARIPFHDSSDSPSFAVDPVSGGPLPWLVSDVIRFLLNCCGFSESQLDIPDIGVRLFLRGDQKPDGVLVLMPGTRVSDYLTMLNRDFINGFLYWEPNMNTSGGWRLRQPPTEATAPLWSFTLTRPAAGPKLTHQSVSYGAATSPILGPDDSSPFETWVVPPEGNCITVSGGWDQKTGERLQMSIVNEESFNAPLHPATADASNLDYISGGAVPIEYVSVELDTQEAVNWIARRIYNLACRGRKFVSFRAECVILDRRTAEPTIFTAQHPRTLLRPGDLVNIIDQAGNEVLHILHSCSPDFSNAGTMYAHYVCELFRPDATYYYVGDLGLPKEVTKREARKALGASPLSPRMLSPQSQRSFLDSEILALPVKPAAPIKAGNTWTFMADFSRLDSDDVLA